MPIKTHLMGMGMPASLANSIVGNVDGGALTATGTNQATALLLSKSFNYIGTTASSTGVQLAACDPGDSQIVSNGGANTLSVYGQTGDAISGGSANAAFSVAANKTAIFYRTTATSWQALLSA